MSLRALSLPNAGAAVAPPPRDVNRLDWYDRRRTWFAYALPVLMAVLLALVPVLRTKATAVFAIAFLPLLLWNALRDTERALYIYCAWCWMDGTIRGIFGGGIVMVAARDVVLVLILIGWGIQRSRTRIQDPIRVPPGTLLVALFVLNCLLETLNPYNGGMLRNLAGLKIHLASIPLFFVGYDVFRRRGQVRSLLLFLSLATVVVSLVSCVQYSQGKDWTYSHFPGTEHAISQDYGASAGSNLDEGANFKPPGTTSFGGGTAVYPGFVFPLLFVLLMLAGRLRFSAGMKAVFVAMMLVYVVTLFVNSVRTALVEAIVGVLLCSFLVGGRLRLRALLALTFCLALGLAGWMVSLSITHGGAADRYGSLFAAPVRALHEDRGTFFDDLPFLLYHSSMGIGMGSTGAATGYLGPRYGLGFNAYSESYLGDMILETGVIGATLITVIALFFLRRGYLAAQNTRQADDRLLAMAMLAVLLLIFFSFFLLPVLYEPPGSVLFWLFAAILLRVYSARPKANRPPAAGRATL